MRKIARREGLSALWRGTDVAFLMAIPTVTASRTFMSLTVLLGAAMSLGLAEHKPSLSSQQQFEAPKCAC